MANRFDNWHLADQLVTAKGAKTCLLTADSKPVVFQPKSRVTCPFGITSWEEDTVRKNLEIRCTPELEAYFDSFDQWAISYIAQNSGRLLKKELSEQTIRENYKPALNKKADYPALLRTKVNTLGTKEVRFWDERGKPAESPEDWKAVECSVKLHIRSLWIMGSSFGWTIECTDIQMHSPVYACPFSTSDAPWPLKESYGEETQREGGCPIAG